MPAAVPNSPPAPRPASASEDVASAPVHSGPPPSPAAGEGECGAAGYHYGVIARALSEIDAAGGTLPLEALAARIGMSPAHFQRVFSRWVGVSPKRYQQYLALDAAKRLGRVAKVVEI